MTPQIENRARDLMTACNTFEEKTGALDAASWAAMKQLFKAIRVADDTPNRTAYVSAAEEAYSSDDIEIDDCEHNVVSGGEDGAFVAAWVWVSDEDAGIPEPCFECGSLAMQGLLIDTERGKLCDQCAEA